MRTIVLLAVLLLSVQAKSQDINYAGLFPTIDHSGKFTEKWSYNGYFFAAAKPYLHQRLGAEDRARFLYLYAETGLSYALRPNLSITASYVYERQNPFEDNYRNEHRLFQQLTLKLPLSSWEIKQRMRFDERFIHDRSTGETPFTHRLRYLLGFSRPLTKQTYLFGYSEWFFNTSRRFKFDENWSALQIGRQWNNQNALELGFLYVGWIYNPSGNWFNQFYLQTTWVSKINAHK